MTDCKYMLFKDSVVVHFNGKTLTIHRDDPRHSKVVAAITEGTLNLIPALADNEASEEIRNLLKIGRRKPTVVKEK